MSHTDAATNVTPHTIALSPLATQGAAGSPARGGLPGVRTPSAATAISGKIGNSTRLAPHMFRFPAKTATTIALRPLPVATGRRGPAGAW